MYNGIPTVRSKWDARAITVKPTSARRWQKSNPVVTSRELDISNKTLHTWIKQYGQPLDVDNASVKELSARVHQLERQLAMREGQIEVLKKAIGIVSQTERNDSKLSSKRKSAVS